MPKTFLLIFLLRPHWAVRSPQRPRVACSPYSVYPSSREETPYTWENIDGPRKYRKAHDDLFDVYKNRWQCITRMKSKYMKGTLLEECGAASHFLPLWGGFLGKPVVKNKCPHEQEWVAQHFAPWLAGQITDYLTRCIMKDFERFVQKA